MDKTKSPAAGGTADTGSGITGRLEGSATEAGTQRPARKWERVLAAFLTGRSFNRFEAARELRDWCLPSTVAELQARGIQIARKDETVPGAFGSVRCCRYWIGVNSVQHARKLLGLPNSGSGAPTRENALSQGGGAA